MVTQKLEKLLPEHEARIPEYVEKWTAIGLSCSESDEVAGNAAVKLMYKIAGHLGVPEVYWFDSLYAATLCAACMQLIENGKTCVKGAAPEAVATTKDSFWDQVIYNTNLQIKEQGQHIDADFINKNKAAICEGAREFIKSSSYWRWWRPGSLGTAAALAFYSFFHEVVGLNIEIERLAGLVGVAHQCSDVLTFDDRAYAIRKMEYMNRDSAGRLHCEDGPAVGFRDGFAIYAWHGVRLFGSEWIITNPKKITAQKIDEENNQELKRILLERFGVDKYAQTGTVIDTDLDPAGRTRTLYKKKIASGQDMLMLKVFNSTPEPDGTHRTYFLEVHPECRPLRRNERGEVSLGERQELTCANAVGSTFGMQGEEYKPFEES